MRIRVDVDDLGVEVVGAADRRIEVVELEPKEDAVSPGRSISAGEVLFAGSRLFMAASMGADSTRSGVQARVSSNT